MAGARGDAQVTPARTDETDEADETEHRGAPRSAGEPEAVPDGGALRELVGDRLRGVWGNPRLLDLVVLAVGLPLAWAFRFGQDDAYISFRYARNLAEGNGLVFNIGERVEGYTNFLWTLLMSVAFRLDVEPLLFAQLVGLACFSVTLLVLRRLATDVFGTGPLAAVAAGVFVASHTVLVYGTGSGLETPLQLVLLTSATLVALRLRRSAGAIDGADDTARVLRGCLLLSALAGLALLTRLDSAVVLVVLAGVVLASLWRNREARPLVGPLVALAVPVVVLLVPWLVWKQSYYGSILPNTLSAKSTPMLWALARAGIYFAVYLVVTFQLLLVPVVVRHRAALRATPELRVLRLLVGVWLLYVVLVGADFMEFRFLVVALPAAAVLVTAVLSSLRSRAVLVFCLLVLTLGSVLKWQLMPPAAVGVESAGALNQRANTEVGWRALGEILAEAFPGGEDSGLVIAVTPAGYIPFYSGLRTVDMLGLTDPDVLEDPCELTKLKAGHEQIARPGLLLDKEVDLVLGSSLVQDAVVDRDHWSMTKVRHIFLSCDVHQDEIPDTAVMVEIPLAYDKVVPALVMEPDDRVLDVAAERGWRVLPIDESDERDEGGQR